MDIVKEILGVKKNLDVFLKKFLGEKTREAQKLDSEGAILTAEIADLTLRGGERLRPAMVAWGFLAAGGKINDQNQKKILAAQGAVELFHSFALIHDDIMDKADLRRGKKVIEPEERAILAGDLCFVFAAELACDFTPQTRKIWLELQKEVLVGQLLDVKFSKSSTKDLKLLRSIIEKIHHHKTAGYSLEKPFLLGMSLGTTGNLNNLNLEKISEALIKIGIVFQMRDDYLDFFGGKSLGKSQGGDLVEGKLTNLHLLILEKFSVADCQKYLGFWGKRKATSEEINWLKRKLQNCGISRQAEEEMQSLKNQAQIALKKTNLKDEAREKLEALADFVAKRNS